MKDFNSPEFKRSRKAYVAQSAIAYFVSILVTDAFLVKLLTSVGLSDSLVGIISSFVSLAFVIQLMSIFMAKSRMGAKKLALIFDTLSIFFFMFLYLIPFIPINKAAKTVLIVVSVIAAYVGKYLVYSIYFKWANSYVSPVKRASFSAICEIISLVSGMLFSLASGFVIDKFEAIGNLNGGFLFIAISVLILNISHFISIALIKKEAPNEQEAGVSFIEALKNTLGNKNFRNVVYLSIMWDVARYFTVGFLGVFKTKDLVISVFTVQIINVASNGLRALISLPFGRFSDRKSSAKGFEMGLIIAAASFACLIFTNKTTWYLIILQTILFNISYAGTNQNSYNITYNYVDSKYFSQAMAIKNSIAGVCGFLASLLGGKLLDIIQANNNQIFGVSIYGQQLLGGISFLITIASIVFLRKVIEKQKILVQ